MRHNPAASYDLGSYMAAAGLNEYDVSYIAQASQLYLDMATLDMAARRFEAQFDTWLKTQIKASLQ